MTPKRYEVHSWNERGKCTLSHISPNHEKPITHGTAKSLMKKDYSSIQIELVKDGKQR